MEDGLKILKVEYLSNHLFDQTQILKFSLDEKTLFFESSKWRRPPMEDDLKILKVEYLSHHFMDFYRRLGGRLEVWEDG